MEDVKCRGSLNVVAAKLPGEWIVRGIYAWKTFDEIRREVEKYVGVLDPRIEWTQHQYDLPYYLMYGADADGRRGGLNMPEVSHVVIYDHKPGIHDCYVIKGRVLS